MKYIKLLFLLLATLLTVACDSDKDTLVKSSFKKGNPYAKEFAGLNGPVKYVIYSHFKGSHIDNTTRDDYSPEGVLTKRKSLAQGDSIVTYYIYDSNNNIQEITGTGIVAYKNQYKKGTLVKEWFYTDKNKKQGYTHRYFIKGETFTKKANNMATGAGITTNYAYNSNGIVMETQQTVNNGAYLLNRYDDKGHISSIEHYTPSGKLRYKESVTGTYDEYGNCVKYIAKKGNKLSTYHKAVYKYYTIEELKNAKKQAESTITKGFGYEETSEVRRPGPRLMGSIIFLTFAFLAFYIWFAQKRWGLFNHFGGEIEIDGMRKMWMYNSAPYLKMGTIFTSIIAAFLSAILLLMVCGGTVWIVFGVIKVILWAIIVVGWILLIGGILATIFAKSLYGIITAVIGAVIVYYSNTLETWGEKFGRWGSDFLDNVNALDWTFAIFSTYGNTIMVAICIPMACFLSLAMLLITISYILRGFEFTALKIYNVNRPCPFCGNTRGFTYMIGNDEYPIPLHPGVYGVFHQTNHFTKLRVPTMLLNGKSKLTRKCSACQHLINKDHDKTYGTDIHIGFVGTRSSGKSYLLYSGLELLSQDFGKDFQQIDATPNNQLEKMLQRIHNNDGIQTAVQNRYKAIQFRLARKLRPLPYHLFFYDVAGEKFNISSSKSQAALEFYNNVKTIVFIIDPAMTDIDKVVPSDKFAEWINKHGNPSEKYDAEGTLGELKKILMQVGRKPKEIDLIITCTKKDLGYLENSNYPYDLDEHMIKKFIGDEMGLTNLLYSTSDFKSVGYAMVSAIDEERTDLHHLFLQILKQRGCAVSPKERIVTKSRQSYSQH